MVPQNAEKPGIDHAFIVNQDSDLKLTEVALLMSNFASMQVFTTQPACVIYTANYLPENAVDKYR